MHRDGSSLMSHPLEQYPSSVLLAQSLPPVVATSGAAGVTKTSMSASDIHHSFNLHDRGHYVVSAPSFATSGAAGATKTGMKASGISHDHISRTCMGTVCTSATCMSRVCTTAARKCKVSASLSFYH